jgi:hypothetical protein
MVNQRDSVRQRRERQMAPPSVGSFTAPSDGTAYSFSPVKPVRRSSVGTAPVSINYTK